MPQRTALVRAATTLDRACGTSTAGKSIAPHRYHLTQGHGRHIPLHLITIRRPLTHVSSNPELNGGGGWGIFNALLGWQNSATYGSVIGYNVYWIVVMAGFIWMRISERRGSKGAAAGAEAGVAEKGVLERKESDENASSDGAVSPTEEVRDGEKGAARETVA
jgi:hypothetical protein